VNLASRMTAMKQNASDNSQGARQDRQTLHLDYNKAPPPPPPPVARRHHPEFSRKLVRWLGRTGLKLALQTLSDSPLFPLASGGLALGARPAGHGGRLTDKERARPCAASTLSNPGLLGVPGPANLNGVWAAATGLPGFACVARTSLKSSRPGYLEASGFKLE